MRTRMFISLKSKSAVRTYLALNLCSLIIKIYVCLYFSGQFNRFFFNFPSTTPQTSFRSEITLFSRFDLNNANRPNNRRPRPARPALINDPPAPCVSAPPCPRPPYLSKYLTAFLSFTKLYEGNITTKF